MKHILLTAVFCCFTLVSMGMDITLITKGMGKGAVKVPVIIKGEKLLTAHKGKKIRRDQIVIKGKKGAVYPVQVDCRTKNGAFIPRKDPWLTAFDEIVFLGDTSRDTQYKVIIASAQKTVPGKGVKVTASENLFTDIMLTNNNKVSIQVKSSGARSEQDAVQEMKDEKKEWVVGETGANALPIEMLVKTPPASPKNKGKKVKRGDFSKGGMTIRFDGISMTDSISWTGLTVPSQPIGRSQNDAPWSKPVIVAQGPVRTIVRITYVEPNAKDIITNGLYVRKGLHGRLAAENLFTLYENSGIIDYQERIYYEKLDQYAMLDYSFSLTAGRGADNKQEIILPDDLNDKSIYTLPIQTLQSYFPKKGLTLTVVHQNPIHQKPLERYYGIAAPGGNGIALFYPAKSDTKLEVSNSLVLRCNPSLLARNFRGTLAPTVSWQFFDGTFRYKGTLDINYRFFLFRKGEKGLIRSNYLFYANSEKHILVK